MGSFTYGVTVTVKGGGCTELVRMIVPVVALESRVMAQTGMAEVVTKMCELCYGSQVESFHIVRRSVTRTGGDSQSGQPRYAII